MDGSLIMSKHPSLRKACGVSDRVRPGNKAYVKILRLYAKVVQRLLSPDSAVAEAKECAVAKRADDDYFSKFKFHTPRKSFTHILHDSFNMRLWWSYKHKSLLHDKHLIGNFARIKN